MESILDRAFFESRLGQKFQIGEVPAEVTLVQCNQLKSQAGEMRGPFSLVFRGPAEAFLPQRTYALKHEQTETLYIFLVPIASDADGFSYEAVFN